MQKRTTLPPADEEIAAHSNVPVEVAALYIGWSTPTLYKSLQEQRAPFGFAVQNHKTGTWAYNISPGLLIKYKRGDLPTYRLDEVINLAAEGVERIVNTKLDAVNRFLGAVSTA